MVALTEETKQEIVRLLGYPDYDTISTDVADRLAAQDYTEANAARISDIISLITRKPDPNDTGVDGCVCGGGIDYQLDTAGIDSGLSVFDKMTFDHNGAIKRLRYLGMKLTSELANIVRISIYYNRYGGKPISTPVSFVAWPN
jgi:hypothetical protein